VRRLKSTLFPSVAQTRKGAPVVSPVSLRRPAPGIRDGGPSDPRFFPEPPLALRRDPRVLLPFETLALLIHMHVRTLRAAAKTVDRPAPSRTDRRKSPSPIVLSGPPFSLTQVQLFEQRACRAELFFDRSLEFFRLLA
jgi:hypothetical protein